MSTRTLTVRFTVIYRKLDGLDGRWRFRYASLFPTIPPFTYSSVTHASLLFYWMVLKILQVDNCKDGNPSLSRCWATHDAGTLQAPPAIPRLVRIGHFRLGGTVKYCRQFFRLLQVTYPARQQSLTRAPPAGSMGCRTDHARRREGLRPPRHERDDQYHRRTCGRRYNRRGCGWCEHLKNQLDGWTGM